MPGAKSTYGGNGGRGLDASGTTVAVAAPVGTDGAAAGGVTAGGAADGAVLLLTETGGNVISGLRRTLLVAAPLFVELDCVVRGVGATPSIPAATSGARSASEDTVESPGRVPLNQASIAAATSVRTFAGSPADESKSNPASMFIPEMPGVVRFADPTYAACDPSCRVK